jgi:mutator protein MutT
MKTVVAALINRDSKFLLAKRSPAGSLPGKWEFPGGKVEPGESDSVALEREILEEFNTLVVAGKLLVTAAIDEQTEIKLYACEHKLGGYHPKVHDEVAWVSSLDAMNLYDLAPADIELLEQMSQDTRKPQLHELEVGQSYKNSDIARIFLVSSQGGMRRSLKANSLVLTSNHNSDNPYDDTWDDQGLMHYTGMGKTGDQSIDYMQNKTLAESQTNGVDVHLFESYQTNDYIYRGRVVLAGEPYCEQQRDDDGQPRQVVKFMLKVF